MESRIGSRKRSVTRQRNFTRGPTNEFSHLIFSKFSVWIFYPCPSTIQLFFPLLFRFPVQRLSLGTRVAFTEASRSNAEWWRDGNRGEPRCSDTSLQRLLLLLPPRYFSFDLNSVTFDAAWRTLRKSEKKMKVWRFFFSLFPLRSSHVSIRPMNLWATLLPSLYFDARAKHKRGWQSEGRNELVPSGSVLVFTSFSPFSGR